MVSLGTFNAHDVEPATDFDPIPAGKYLAIISDSEMKPTKSGNGSYLELTFQVIEGQYKNRLLWTRLNLDNPNATAVQIARSELSSICRAAGLMTPKDSAELHNLPIVISVKCKKRDDTGDVTNEIKGYAKRELAGGHVPQAASNVAPWRRG
jgi:Protein of unknown function (DUF669)